MTALREEYPHTSVGTLCGLFGKKRQWYYKSADRVISEKQRIKLLTDMMQYYRSLCPRIGGVKLFHILSNEIGIEVTHGRDSFLKVYEAQGFKLKPNKRRRTTDSNHIYKKYPNLIRDTKALYVNHIWVADITYVWILGDVLYLHLITDVYSHAILGWCLAESLEAKYTIRALNMAIATSGGGNLCGTIHHSDRGSQYACHEYIDILTEHHIRISMTERYNPTDNAVAERINGILKVEWIYQQEMYKDYETALFEIGCMIDFYNNKRPHMSIGNKIPMEVYCGELPGENLWKKKEKLVWNKKKAYLCNAQNLTTDGFIPSSQLKVSGASSPN